MSPPRALKDRLLGASAPRRRVSFKGPASTAPAADVRERPAAEPVLPEKEPESSGVDGGQLPELDARGVNGRPMPSAVMFAKSGEIAAAPDGHIWVVIDPGFSIALGGSVVLYRDCVVLGERGFWILDDATRGEPVPI